MPTVTDKFINAIGDLMTAWRKAGGRDGTHQRFGQYVMNSTIDGLPANWPELFYVEDPRVAYGMLYQHAHELVAA